MSKRLVYGNEAGQRARRFLVHFVAHDTFDLKEYLERMSIRIARAVQTEAPHMQSIEVTITPYKLRQFIESVPKDVVVSYEEKAPEAC